MDLNYLIRRQPDELVRAEAAASDEARQAHEELARKYADRIRALTAGRLTILRNGAKAA